VKFPVADSPKRRLVVSRRRPPARPPAARRTDSCGPRADASDPCLTGVPRPHPRPPRPPPRRRPLARQLAPPPPPGGPTPVRRCGRGACTAPVTLQPDLQIRSDGAEPQSQLAGGNGVVPHLPLPGDGQTATAKPVAPPAIVKRTAAAANWSRASGALGGNSPALATLARLPRTSAAWALIGVMPPP